ncbi:MAG: hypothetical protein IKQ41_12705 [Clostridia bacterium]|nr:hypothetical protein [Clostridia bacterium]
MHKTKVTLLLATLLACVLCVSIALAESSMAGLWQSGCDFLFHTDNVTVTGEATFSLDGERFKTAKLNYIQDGYHSYYGLTLLTPRADGTEQETGWTILADETGNYYVMEAYFPGTYRIGNSLPQNSLLRRTVRLDALANLGGLLIGQIEPLLPDGVITQEEKDGVKCVHLALSDGQTPDIALSALNVAAIYLSDRWFAIEHSIPEDGYVLFENYTTKTNALTDGTIFWKLKSADVDFVLDAQGRFSSVKGTVSAESTFWDQSVRTVEVAFSLDMTAYGESHVKPFDPADYNVELMEFEYAQEEMGFELIPIDSEEMDALMDKAAALLATQGFTIDPNASRGGWNMGAFIDVSFMNPDDVEYNCTFAEDGSVLMMQAYWTGWAESEEKEPEGVEEETIAAAKALIQSFIDENNPALSPDIPSLTLFSMMKPQEGGTYLVFGDAEQSIVIFVVQVEPAMRIVHYAEFI